MDQARGLVRFVIVTPDLLFATRVAGIVEARHGSIQRVDDPGSLGPPDDLDLVLVDWGSRAETWGKQLRAWVEKGGTYPVRVIVYGPHTDLDSHAAARADGFAPMWARSRVLSALPGLISEIAG